MKRKYISPTQRIIDLLSEAMMANSIGVNGEHADGDFQELSKKKKEQDLWGNEDVWK